jgi:hypothetical protein
MRALFREIGGVCKTEKRRIAQYINTSSWYKTAQPCCDSFRTLLFPGTAPSFLSYHQSSASRCRSRIPASVCLVGQLSACRVLELAYSAAQLKSLWSESSVCHWKVWSSGKMICEPKLESVTHMGTPDRQTVDRPDRLRQGTFQWQTLDSDHNDFSWAAEYASSFADALSAGANYDRLAEDCSLLAGWLAMAEVPLSPTSERGDADDSQFGKKGASMVCFDPKKVPEDQGDCDNDVRAQRFRCTVFPGITREEMGKAIRTRREEGCLPQELLLPNLMLFSKGCLGVCPKPLSGLPQIW